ncbi:MAG: hypothetical protein JSS60_09105 [Verrucomicrobia bacterium]|nr:hypothetical protein [Verrucomicrobiota bacterium]
MAIYDFSKADKTGASASALPQRRFPDEGASAAPEMTDTPPQLSRRDQIFSALAARLFFFLLFLADLLWIGYALIRLAVALIGMAVTGGKVGYFMLLCEKAWVSSRRSFVCGVSLLVALCSPAFGIMIACTYFLMYDKSGIEEVVPSSLQSQFKEFLPEE